MPPSNFTCPICGDEVSKRQSYAYKGGRACKAHQEAQEAKEKNDQSIAAKRKRVQEKFEKRRESPRDLLDPSFLDRHCWSCGNEGVSRQNHATNMLLAMARERLRGEFNLLTNPLKTLELAGYTKDTRFLLQYPDSSKVNIIKEAQFPAVMLKFVILCQHCATDVGYDPAQRADELAPRLTPEAMSTMMAVGSMSGINDEIAELAKELEQATGVELTDAEIESEQNKSYDEGII